MNLFCYSLGGVAQNPRTRPVIGAAAFEYALDWFVAAIACVGIGDAPIAPVMGNGLALVYIIVFLEEVSAPRAREQWPAYHVAIVAQS